MGFTSKSFPNIFPMLEKEKLCEVILENLISFNEKSFSTTHQLCPHTAFTWCSEYFLVNILPTVKLVSYCLALIDLRTSQFSKTIGLIYLKCKLIQDSNCSLVFTFFSYAMLNYFDPKQLS